MPLCHPERSDLVFTRGYEILRSLRALRMTGRGTFAEVSSRSQTGGTGVSPVQAQAEACGHKKWFFERHSVLDKFCVGGPEARPPHLFMVLGAPQTHTRLFRKVLCIGGTGFPACAGHPRAGILDFPQNLPKAGAWEPDRKVLPTRLSPSPSYGQGGATFHDLPCPSRGRVRRRRVINCGLGAFLI